MTQASHNTTVLSLSESSLLWAIPKAFLYIFLVLYQGVPLQYKAPLSQGVLHLLLKPPPTARDGAGCSYGKTAWEPSPEGKQQGKRQRAVSGSGELPQPQDALAWTQIMTQPSRIPVQKTIPAMVLM